MRVASVKEAGEAGRALSVKVIARAEGLLSRAARWHSWSADDTACVTIREMGLGDLRIDDVHPRQHGREVDKVSERLA